MYLLTMRLNNFQGRQLKGGATTNDNHMVVENTDRVIVDPKQTLGHISWEKFFQNIVDQIQLGKLHTPLSTFSIE